MHSVRLESHEIDLDRHADHLPSSRGRCIYALLAVVYSVSKYIVVMPQPIHSTTWLLDLSVYHEVVCIV